MTLFYLATGLIAGVLSGMFGIGGGLVIVPALVFFAKMSQRTAVGTSLGALLLPVGALGVYAYWSEGQVDVKAAMWIALGMFLGAQAVSESLLKRAFAVLLVMVAGRLWMTS